MIEAIFWGATLRVAQTLIQATPTIPGGAGRRRHLPPFARA